MEKSVQYSIGESGYRYTIKGSCDFPGAVDVVYQEWDKDIMAWKTKEGLYGLKPEVLKSLVDKADVVIEWEDAS